MERKFAAILAVDVVGYGGLMERDEAGTFAALKAHRQDLIDPKIACCGATLAGCVSTKLSAARRRAAAPSTG